MNTGNNCNSTEVNKTMEKRKDNLLRTANLEAATDIMIEGDQLVKAAKNSAGLTVTQDKLYEGVTENAPFKNTAKYTMVEYHSETGDNENTLQNFQSS